MIRSSTKFLINLTRFHEVVTKLIRQHFHFELEHIKLIDIKHFEDIKHSDIASPYRARSIQARSLS